MTAAVSTRCRGCGRELTDRFSRTIGWGPECRKGMTRTQLVAAIRANTPGQLPTEPDRPRRPSPQARRNRVELQRATAPIPTTPECPHGDRPASCALCRRDNDPARAAERILTLTLRTPIAERLANERAAARHLWRAHTPLETP